MALADTPRPPWLLAAGLSVPALLGVWLGYGTDIDAAHVLVAGESALAGDYSYSRPPGAIVHEVGSRLLDAAGGPMLVSIVSVVLGFLVLAGVGWLIRIEGRRADLTLAVVAASPWWWVASTSLVDAVWALAAVVAGAVQRRRGSTVTAALAFGIAVGIRASSVLLVAAWLLAEQLGRDRPPLRTTLFVAAGAVGIAAVAFVPSWLAVDRTAAFLTNEFDVSGPVTLLGRWMVKNVAFFGLVVIGAVTFGVRQLREGLTVWSTSIVVRFGVLGFVASELLFLRFPWKPLHLLPALLCLALVVSASPSTRWKGVLVAGGLVHAVVAVTVAAPNVPDAATTGEVRVAVTPGVVVNDIACRLDDRSLGSWSSPPGDEEAGRAFDLFQCQAKLWRSPTD